jgi:phospholipase/carboxylesterase
MRVLYGGAEPGVAEIGMILIHGRGSSAEDIMGISKEIVKKNIFYAAPEAEGNSWYPYSFLAPRELNEPGITNGLAKIDELIEGMVEKGITRERIYILGFSQGACLSADYIARSKSKIAGAFLLSGGLIGEHLSITDYLPFERLRTNIFIGCSDNDPHIPVNRLSESENIFNELGAMVELRLYRNMAHTINLDEVNRVNELLAAQKV